MTSKIHRKEDLNNYIKLSQKFRDQTLKPYIRGDIGGDGESREGSVSTK